MPVKAKVSYLRIAPRKVRLVADLIRGKKAIDAKNILGFTTKKAAEPILKLLNSALANAKNNLKIETDNLFVSKIEVNEGPKLKRWRPRARGRAFEIQKKTSHVNLILDEMKAIPVKKTKTKKKITKKHVS
ncbi:MAG: 50S ribosomal protein L22 [Candidatus Nealsonbacteria bacterium]